MDVIEAYLGEVEQMVRDIPRRQVCDVVQLLFQACQMEKHIFLLGNGGSAATASHMANDLNKLTITPGKPRCKALALTDNVPQMTAWGNDTDYANIFAEQMLNFLQPGDMVIGISTSGNSPNILKTLQVARQHNAVTIGFSGRNGGKLRDLVDYAILIPNDHTGQLEDAHMILVHVIANTLKQLLSFND